MVSAETLQEKYLREITQFYWANGYNPEQTQMERLAHFAEIVTEKNAAVNLVSRKDVESIIENHVFISSYIANFVPDKCQSFLDIGTGGGFPGIPLAIMKPMMRGVLVDSIGKKIDAVKEFIERLMMINCKAVNSRVEDPAFVQEYTERFDLVVTRATVPLIKLLDYSFPLLKQKSYILSLKGGDLTDEFSKIGVKYKSIIRKQTVFELHYKPTNTKNEKGKKLVLLEIEKTK